MSGEASAPAAAVGDDDSRRTRRGGIRPPAAEPVKRRKLSAAATTSAGAPAAGPAAVGLAPASDGAPAAAAGSARAPSVPSARPKSHKANPKGPRRQSRKPPPRAPYDEAFWQVWPQCEAEGWCKESVRDVNGRTQYNFLPPGVSRRPPFKARVDYYTSVKQVLSALCDSRFTHLRAAISVRADEITRERSAAAAAARMCPGAQPASRSKNGRLLRRQYPPIHTRIGESFQVAAASIPACRPLLARPDGTAAAAAAGARVAGAGGGGGLSAHACRAAGAVQRAPSLTGAPAAAAPAAAPAAAECAPLAPAAPPAAADPREDGPRACDAEPECVWDPAPLHVSARARARFESYLSRLCVPLPPPLPSEQPEGWRGGRAADTGPASAGGGTRASAWAAVPEPASAPPGATAGATPGPPPPPPPPRLRPAAVAAPPAAGTRHLGSAAAVATAGPRGAGTAGELVAAQRATPKAEPGAGPSASTAPTPQAGAAIGAAPCAAAPGACAAQLTASAAPAVAAPAAAPAAAPPLSLPLFRAQHASLEAALLEAHRHEHRLEAAIGSLGHGGQRGARGRSRGKVLARSLSAAAPAAETAVSDGTRHARTRRAPLPLSPRTRTPPRAPPTAPSPAEADGARPGGARPAPAPLSFSPAAAGLAAGGSAVPTGAPAAAAAAAPAAAAAAPPAAAPPPPPPPRAEITSSGWAEPRARAFADALRRTRKDLRAAAAAVEEAGLGPCSLGCALQYYYGCFKATPEYRQLAAQLKEKAEQEWTESLHNDDECALCGFAGNLLCCDCCSRSFHLLCLSPPLDAVPDGEWRCPVCAERAEQAAAPEEERAVAPEQERAAAPEEEAASTQPVRQPSADGGAAAYDSGAGSSSRAGGGGGGGASGAPAASDGSASAAGSQPDNSCVITPASADASVSGRLPALPLGLGAQACGDSLSPGSASLAGLGAREHVERHPHHPLEFTAGQPQVAAAGDVGDR